MVIAKVFGVYKEGDILTMPDSTALACVKTGVVASVNDVESIEVKSIKKKSKNA